MVEGQACARLHQQISVQVFAFEFRPQVMRQIVRHEITSIRMVRAEAMNFSEGIVKGRIKALAVTSTHSFGMGSSSCRRRETSSAGVMYSGSRAPLMSIGWAVSLKSAVIFLTRLASA